MVKEWRGLEVPCRIHEVWNVALVVFRKSDDPLHVLWRIQIGLERFEFLAIAPGPQRTVYQSGNRKD